ncbi:MAG: hypothetical protein E4H20_00020 [Spirochaetales bacterium]|nr:MAG: hypothetical protein E4H20_00020 [Spirochaetales bacterium]
MRSISMKSRRLILTAALLVLGTALAFSQAANQSLILEFVQGNDLTVTYPDNTIFTYASGGIFEGDALPIGSSVRTGSTTTVELRLSPNGTLIKIAKSTTFRVEGLATPQDNRNGFTLLTGKVRAVAAKGSNYEVYTASTVAGVRGTDFSMSYEEGKKAMLLVARGAVEFGKRSADGISQSFVVNAGQFADFFGSFVPQAFNQAVYDAEYGDMEIDPARMPPSALEDAAASPTEEGDGQPVDAALEDTEDGEAAASEETSPAAPESAFVTWLREALGMEIGSITINEQTYAKAVIQPTIKLGKLKTALYLPIIYSKNLFDPSDWYHPNGNDEWSFGTDIGWSSDPWGAFKDAAADVALKFKYIEYGQPLVDPFFIKAGNLNDFTVGHGLVMRNYANDTEFPAIRRLGLNIGMDLGSWGFEALANDLAQPEIFGGRLYLRPVPDFKLAFGLSAVADIAPASIFNTVADPNIGADTYGDPIFIGAGVDLDLPIITTSILGIRAFSDFAAMLPIVRNDVTAGDYAGLIDQGAAFDMIYADGALRNWGAAAGFMGNVLFIDWRLEYRYFTGAFRPAFFDSGYERSRADRTIEWSEYLSGNTAVDQSPSVMGIYGEGGTSIFNDKLNLTFGYFWPWSADADTLSQQAAMANDYFKAVLTVKKGLIPIINVSGAITYERKNFVPTLIGSSAGGYSLFDENTVFSGELVLPVPGAPNLDLAFIVTTVIARQDNGDVIYRDAPTNTKPEIKPAVTLETRLHF